MAKQRELSSKQRAFLRGEANSLQAIFQIGKDGLSKALIDGVDGALETRELVKISILETADVDVRRSAERIASATDAQVVQCIGRKIILYRESKTHKIIEL